MSKLQSKLNNSFQFQGNQVDVVSQIEGDDVFYDLFDAQSGQCINEGSPLFEEPFDLAGELTELAKSTLLEFYAPATTQ